MFRICVSLATLLLLLSSCRSCDCWPDAETLKSFTVGQSTVTDVKNRLGEPGQATANGDGGTTLVYDYSRPKPTWGNSIPIAGVFIGGFDKLNQQDKFDFNADGKLTAYTQTEAVNGTMLPPITSPNETPG